jgi:hypothetical protein
MDNSIEQNLLLYMLFVDFKKAYETIKKEKAYDAMREMGIKEELIRLVRMTLKEMEKKLLANGQLRIEVTTEGSKYSFEKVNKFNYLGVTITDNGEEKEEIKERIAKGIKSMGGLLHMKCKKEYFKECEKNKI